MALLDGLRGGQALLNMVEFGPGIQMPDDSRMYSMRTSGRGHGSTSNKKDKDETPKDVEFLEKADREYAMVESEIESAKDMAYSTLYSDFVNSGLDQKTWLAKNKDKISGVVSFLNEKEIELQSYKNLEKLNTETFKSIVSDPTSENDYARMGTSDNIVVNTIVKDNEGKLVQGEKLMSPEGYVFAIDLQRKILQNPNKPLSDDETKKAKEVLGDDYDVLLRNSIFAGKNVKQYAYQQDKQKPLGVPFDQSGYIPEQTKKDIESNISSKLQSASNQVVSGYDIVGSNANAIAEGYGGVRYTKTTQNSIDAINNTIEQYVGGFSKGQMNMGMSNTEQKYWANEWMRSAELGEKMIQFEYDKNGKPKLSESGEQKFKVIPVSSMQLKDYVKSKLLYRAQPKMMNDIQEQIYRKSETKQGLEAAEKSNWLFEYEKGNVPKVQIVYDGDPFTGINYEGPLKGIFESYKNVVLKNIKESGRNPNNPELVKGANIFAMDQIKKDILSGKIIQNKGFMDNVGDFLSDWAMYLGNENSSMQDIKNMKNVKSTKQVLEVLNTITTKNPQLYSVWASELPTNSEYRNVLPQANEFKNPNQNFTIGGVTLSAGDLGNMSIKMAKDRQILFIDNFKTKEDEDNNKPERRIVRGTYEIYPNSKSEKIDVDKVKKQLVDAGMPEIIVEGMKMQYDTKRVWNNKSKGYDEIPIVYVQGYETIDDAQFYNMKYFGETPKRFDGIEGTTKQLEQMSGDKAVE